MPYTIATDDDGQYCVYKAGSNGEPTGDTLGCHKTQDQAAAQIGAIEANEKGEHAMPEQHTRIMRAYVDRAGMADEPGAPMRFVASTEDVARDGGIVAADGWSLDSYRANPVFLWAHDYATLPLGRAEVEVQDGRLMASVTFDQADDFARQVESKYRRGFLNAVSVGWNTTEYADARALPEGALWMSLKHELLDVSAVPVPADPGALAERQRSALAAWTRALMQPEPETQPEPDNPQPDATDGEPAWADVAAAMVACVRTAGDDPEEARLAQYNALLPTYRRLGKVAPEWLGDTVVSALGPAELRGLFLSGEPDLCPDAFAEPEPPTESPTGDRGGDDGPAAGSVLAEIAERLESRVLRAVLARLEAKGIAAPRDQAPEPQPEPSTSGGDDGAGQRDTPEASAPIDSTLQGILERLESRNERIRERSPDQGHL